MYIYLIYLISLIVKKRKSVKSWLSYGNELAMWLEYQGASSDQPDLFDMSTEDEDPRITSLKNYVQTMAAVEPDNRPRAGGVVQFLEDQNEMDEGSE